MPFLVTEADLQEPSALVIDAYQISQGDRLNSPNQEPPIIIAEGLTDEEKQILITVANSVNRIDLAVEEAQRTTCSAYKVGEIYLGNTIYTARLSARHCFNSLIQNPSAQASLFIDGAKQSSYLAYNSSPWKPYPEDAVIVLTEGSSPESAIEIGSSSQSNLRKQIGKPFYQIGYASKGNGKLVIQKLILYGVAQVGSTIELEFKRPDGTVFIQSEEGGISGGLVVSIKNGVPAVYGTSRGISTNDLTSAIAYFPLKLDLIPGFINNPFTKMERIN